MTLPKFVAFEGIDGSGKSTQARRLGERLRAEGVPVVLTAEPTQGAVGRVIREMLNADREESWSYDWRAMTLLFAADRAAHLTNLIEPVLLAGETVICDRFVLSTVAYQLAGALKQLDRAGVTLSGSERRAARAEMGVWMRQLFDPFRRPDLTIVLLPSVDVALARVGARGGPPEKYEKADYLRDVASTYRAAATTREFSWYSNQIWGVSGEGPEDEVAQHVWEAYNEARSR